ncbi:DUF6702 family protein [Urechidicola vernalis]|uniref:Peptidase E n=1 Tax=Urechidicola vernalis TaxID=3075600 RepID=A0ABU2Y4F6_9FLAO|nr:DUF6702 family protein [Urechidicola sp. P050]MDT0552539.1 hypothetical protein [Urechidicola sp. P050]
MKLLLFLFASTTMFAHDYYFAFAEMAFNNSSSKFETTISISTHDLEHALENINKPVGHLEKVHVDSEEFKVLEAYLLSHFKVTFKTPVSFNLLGFESKLDGVTYFYLESDAVELQDTIKVKFDALMEMHKEQQNKMTFYHNDKSYSKPFLYTNRIQIINLNK